VQGRWGWVEAVTLAVVGLAAWWLSGNNLTPKRRKPPFTIAGCTLTILRAAADFGAALRAVGESLDALQRAKC
jgi:hypothetical protein